MLTLCRDSFWISPYVFSAYVTLREKDLAFDVKEVALQKKAQHAPDYVRKSVTGRVPSLDHDDFTLAESMAIVEYLEDAFPETPRVLPKEPRERARARQLMAWLRSDDTLAIREQRSAETIFYDRETKPLDANARRATEKLFAIAERLVADAPSTTQGAHLFSTWSVADADLAFMLHRLMTKDDGVPAKLCAYAEAQWKRPSVRAFVEQARVPFVPY